MREIDKMFIDKIKSKLPKGYELLGASTVTQNGDILWNSSSQNWSDVVDESWRQSPDYHYPIASFFKAVARNVI
jgi:hypothetical protein